MNGMFRRIRILHIIASWQSGLGNELAAFAERLEPDEFEYEVCTLDLRWSYDAVAYMKLRRTLRRFQPDIVHTWDTSSQLYAALQQGNPKIVAEKRDAAPTGQTPLYRNEKTHRFIASRKMDDCPKTVIIPPSAIPGPFSEPMPAEQLLEALDVPLVEPSGDYYPVLQPQYEPARRNFKAVPPNATPYIIGIVLPLTSEHRILDALWVCETFKHVHLNYHAFFIGEGRAQEECLRYRDRWKLFSRVHFVGGQGRSGWALTSRLLPSFDALLHLSPSAEHSNVILSAMSCGVPVVAVETPKSRQYIVDGISGILIPCEDADKETSGKEASSFYRRTAAKKLLHLLENQELRRSLSKAGKERVAKEFNFDKAVQCRKKLYRDIAR